MDVLEPGCCLQVPLRPSLTFWWEAGWAAARKALATGSAQFFLALALRAWHTWTLAVLALVKVLRGKCVPWVVDPTALRPAPSRSREMTGAVAAAPAMKARAIFMVEKVR